MRGKWKARPGKGMIWLGGGQQDVLDQAPGDRARYVANGTMILATALVAVVSATVALQMAMHLPVYAALPFGLGWGLLILMVDRMLVLSMVRWRGARGFAHTLVTLILRILMAAVLGAVVSTPLVLRIFQPEIAAEVKIMQRESASAFQRQLDSDARFVRLPQLRQAVADEQAVVDAGPVAVVDDDPDVVRARQAVTSAEVAFAGAQQAVVCEKEGTCGSGRAGAGIAFAEKVQIRHEARRALEDARAALAATVSAATVRSLEAARNRIASARQQLAVDQAELTRLVADKAAIEQRQLAAIDESGGILQRLDALHRLSQREQMIETAHWLLWALFMIIELLPLISKLFQIMGPKSLYERLVEARDDHTLFAATYAVRVQRRIDRIRARVPLTTESDLAERRVNANKEVNAAVVAKQREVTDRTLRAWGEDVSARNLEEIANWVPARTTRMVDIR